jgi:hypothetical protein
VARVFVQEEEQLRRPRDDPFRRQAITRCRQPGRSLWLSAQLSWHDCIGDKALVRIGPDLQCSARALSPRRSRPGNRRRTIAFDGQQSHDAGRARDLIAREGNSDAIPLLSRLPNQHVGLPFTSWVCMLMGMDTIELYDAAVGGGARHREEVA